MESRTLEVSQAEAVQAVREGRRVLMTVGLHPDDPALLVWDEDGTVMSESIAGWSAGVREAVCAIGSPFLDSYFATKPDGSLVVAQGAK